MEQDCRVQKYIHGVCRCWDYIRLSAFRSGTHALWKLGYMTDNIQSFKNVITTKLEVYTYVYNIILYIYQQSYYNNYQYLQKNFYFLNPLQVQCIYNIRIIDIDTSIIIIPINIYLNYNNITYILKKISVVSQCTCTLYNTCSSLCREGTYVATHSATVGGLESAEGENDIIQLV